MRLVHSRRHRTLVELVGRRVYEGTRVLQVPPVQLGATFLRASVPDHRVRDGRNGIGAEPRSSRPGGPHRGYRGIGGNDHVQAAPGLNHERSWARFKLTGVASVASDVRMILRRRCRHVRVATVNGLPIDTDPGWRLSPGWRRDNRVRSCRDLDVWPRCGQVTEYISWTVQTVWLRSSERRHLEWRGVLRIQDEQAARRARVPSVSCPSRRPYGPRAWS